MGRKLTRCAALAAITTIVSVARGDFAYQSQTREVEALIDWSAGIASDLDNAFGFDASSLAVSANYASPSGPGVVIATQESVLAANSLSVSGAVTIGNPFFAHENAFYIGRTVFDVGFLVDAATPYTLDAAFAGIWDTGGTNINSGIFEINFSGPGGVIVDDTRSTPAASPGGVFNPPLVYAASGTLQPGLYSLRIAFTDQLLAIGSTTNPPFSYGVGGGGNAGFSLALIAPEPGAGLAVLLAAALAAGERRR